MRLIADTHALIWWLTDPGRLSRRAFAAMEDEGNDVVISAVTAYEIEFKRRVDPLLQVIPMDLEAAVLAQRFGWRPITPADAMAAGRLPRHHRDPWDRLLVAQCLQEGAALISRDGDLAAYGAKLIW